MPAGSKLDNFDIAAGELRHFQHLPALQLLPLCMDIASNIVAKCSMPMAAAIKSWDTAPSFNLVVEISVQPVHNGMEPQQQ